MSQQTVAIIPAYNESKTIKDIVSEVKNNLPVIVIDDGSTDQTSEAAKEGGAIVVNHSYNKGYEAALTSGIKINSILIIIYSIFNFRNSNFSSSIWKIFIFKKFLNSFKFWYD